MGLAAHHNSIGDEAWRRTAIAEFPRTAMYATSGVLDDTLGLEGIVSSTHVRNGRIHSPPTGRQGPGGADPNRATLKEGDLAVVLVRRAGDTAFVTAEHAGLTATRSIGIIRGELGVTRWLRIWLQTPTAKARIDEEVTAHVEPTMSLSTLRRMPFPLPPPDVIAKYHRAFSLIEDMIDLRHDAARKAVELADAIHDEWSVASPAWETRLLNQVAKARTGKGPARSLPPRTQESAVDAIAPTDLFDLTVPHVERFRLSSQSDSAEAWLPGTLMLSTRPDGAHLAVTQRPASPTRGVVAVRPVDDKDCWWLLHELRSRSHDIAQVAQGRNAREISARALSRLSVTWPDSFTRADFHTVTDPLHALARQLVSESATLHDLKDALLHDISAKAEILTEERMEPDEEGLHTPQPSTVPSPPEGRSRS